MGYGKDGAIGTRFLRNNCIRVYVSQTDDISPGVRSQGPQSSATSFMCLKLKRGHRKIGESKVGLHYRIAMYSLEG